MQQMGRCMRGEDRITQLARADPNNRGKFILLLREGETAEECGYAVGKEDLLPRWGSVLTPDGLMNQ
eukprot:15468351-Heterocapsa_arctica.AAC.1